MVICRDAAALATAMNSDAVPERRARRAEEPEPRVLARARGIPWAALRSLGRAGVATMVEQHCAQAARVADGLRAAGYDVLNRVVLNQVLVRAGTDDETAAILAAAQASGDVVRHDGVAGAAGVPDQRVVVAHRRRAHRSSRGLADGAARRARALSIMRRPCPERLQPPLQALDEMQRGRRQQRMPPHHDRDRQRGHRLGEIQRDDAA